MTSAPDEAAPRRNLWMQIRQSPRTRFAVILVAALAVLWLVQRNSDDSQAKEACQSRVESSLKAPATAEFGELAAFENDDEAYEVSGWVDAENGFGAMVRTRFDCYVEEREYGWTVTSLDTP